MCSKQFTNIAQKELDQHHYVRLSQIKKKLGPSTQDQNVISEALAFRHSHTEFEILCFVRYEENNVIHCKYEVDSYVQQILRERKRLGKSISDIFVEFLCLFRTSYFHFNQIVQIMIDSTKEIYADALENQIERNLTVIPPNAIMKNGKKYCEINQVKSNLTQTSSKNSISSIDNKRQPLQKSKSFNNELPRMNESKAQLKKQEQPKPKQVQKPQTKKEEKKPVPHKKLQIQSDQSQDYYVPGQPIQMFQSTKPAYKPEPMQIQNQGNFKQNQHPKPQKMQIEGPSKNLNHKQTTPKTDKDQQDSMNFLMEQMQKEDKVKIQKPSIAAKSQPAGKQTKLDFSKFQPTKSVATKQASISGWMNKK